MGTTALGIQNHFPTAGQSNAVALGKPTQSAVASGQAGTSSGEAASISANDFLTLLVTELKNQDPTANTDPNEYINQLVQVNSLEQLISINQTLTAASDTSNGNSGVTTPGASAPGSSTPGTERAGRAVASEAASAPQTLSGNLSIPGPNPSADRVAHALGGARLAL